MTRYLPILLLGTLCALAGCTRQQPPPDADPASLRKTAAGAVVGFADRHDTWSWLGIPYAAAPVGELRWRAPQPAPARENTLEALSFPPMCPQMPIPMVNDTGEPTLGREDCLYLNVSAPRSWAPGEPALPVMLWLHGGGNTVGSTDLYPAVRNLAARGDVVTVSIHYRLGVLGWFNHPALRATAADEFDASGNFGTLDTIAALRWVRENIAAFGGDPQNVTVFGESAGGMNVFALLLSPLAEGLFHRAASQSGLLLTSEISLAENPVDATPAGSVNSSGELLLRLLQAEGRAADREQAAAVLAQWSAAEVMDYLRGQPADVLLGSMHTTEWGLYEIPVLLRDGVVLPSIDPLQALQKGEFNRVPVLMGTNRDEVKTMMTRSPDYIELRFGLLPRVADQALFDRVTGYGSAMWKVLGADDPARAMALAGHEPIYIYRFDWDETPDALLVDFGSLLGAGHSLEIPFVFHDMDNEMEYLPFDLITDENRERASALADDMSAYWLAFARGGAPGRGAGNPASSWPAWGAEENFLVLDTAAGGGVRTAQGGVQRDAVYRQLAGDAAALGGSEAVCRAYDNLFGQDSIFRFSTGCDGADDCPAARKHFCD